MPPKAEVHIKQQEDHFNDDYEEDFQDTIDFDVDAYLNIDSLRDKVTQIVQEELKILLPKILAQEINLAKVENKFEPAVIIQEEKEVASELSFEDIKEEEIEQPVEEHQDAHAEVHVEDEIKPLVELPTEELKPTPIKQPIVIEQEETIPDDDPEEDRCKPIELENKPIDKKRHAFEK
mmetsp:Transcript_42875/g.50279  ORF Transcript_42875/g.50279 Transcript_42875/m.50279 type:complete len:178 (-) Transcript_42875:213-746(-)